MVDLLEGSPISTRTLWSSVRVTPRVPAHPPGQGPSSLTAQFGRKAGQGRVLVVSNVLHDGGQCALRDL